MNTDKVVIGKNIIEILTTGMYNNPLVIYREYIQNSVDSINQAITLELFQELREGEINITVNSEKKHIEFYDNATGISAKDAWNRLTSVAASTKDRNNDLGFRGIGRLAGLAYCEKLTIETSFKGESVKSQLVWDGDKLRSIIANRDDQKRAHEVIDSITTFRNDLQEETDKHYFCIRLQQVKNEKLLNISEVEKYLRMVAPVAFSPQFIYANHIRDGLIDRGVSIGEYRVFVNTNEVFKPYRTNIYKTDSKSEKVIDEIISIEFFEITGHGEVLAIGWYGLTSNLQRIPVYNEPYGIRIRKGNIQIGDQFTMQRFYREERFHNYFVGELHVISQNLIPNGQRDYFDECELITVFEQQMKSVAGKLSKLCHDASNLNSAANKIESFSNQLNEFKRKQSDNEFISSNHEEEEKQKLDKIEKEAVEAENKIKKIEERAEENEPLKKLVDRRKKGLENKKNQDKPENELKNSKKKKKYKSHKLSALNRKEQKLIGEVYEVIRTILTPDLAENLILKIEEKFSGKDNEKKQSTT